MELINPVSTPDGRPRNFYTYKVSFDRLCRCIASMLYCILMILLLAACSTTNTGMSESEFVAINTTMMHFYKHPSQQKFQSVLHSYNATLAYAKEHHLADKESLEHIEQLFTTWVSFVWGTYDYSGSPFPEEKMRDIVLKLESTSDIARPGDLDMFWAAFFATGMPSYVDIIISAQESNNEMIAGAARWSIQANAESHKLIGEIVAEQSKKTKTEALQP